MTTSSAKPAKLHAYRDGGLAQVEAWEPEVTNLDTALTALRGALAGLDLPEGCELSVLFYETWFDTLVRNQRHLDEWVGDVGDEFIRAAGGDPDDIGADQSFTVDDAQIEVGYASRAASEAQAAEDAAALDAILGEYGLLHPYDIGNDPDKLEEMAQQYPELRDILARADRFRDDENYAAALVNELGPQNVRTMADLANTFGLAHDQGHLDDDGAYEGYVVPLAAILGNADRSGRMDPSVREALFDMDATDEAPYADTNGDFIQEDQLRDMRYRSMALLLNAGDHSAQTTSDMANAIIHDGPVAPQFYDYSGFTDVMLLDEHPELASNEWAALAALERDDHAANIFYTHEYDGYDNLYLMGGALVSDVAARRLGLAPDDAAERVNQTLANTMTGGILEYPLATGTTYEPQTIDLVTRMIEAAGYEHIDAPDSVRQAMAQISTPYTIDLAIASEGHRDDLPDGRLAGVSETELDAFFQEVSESRPARIVLGQNAAALVTDQIGVDADLIAAGDANAFGRGHALSAAYYRELGEAWDATQIGWVEQREALVAGWRSFSDPVVDLVSGKIVEKIPVVNVAAEMPGVEDVVDGITDGIRDRINGAIYDNLIPEPELEAMTTWRDAVEDDVYSSVATGLYQDESTRSALLERGATEEPELYAEITADGNVTQDEFRRLHGVANAVNTQGRKIVDGFETDMAFNRLFGEGD